MRAAAHPPTLAARAGMPWRITTRSARHWLALGLLAAAVGRAADAPAPPAAAGLDGCTAVAPLLREATGPRGYLGAVALIAQHGRIVCLQAFGHRDLARQDTLRTDAIFRIYSMSKPVAALATLLLVEQGALALDDPVARFLPGFADLQVMAGGTADAPELRAAHRALTIRHLLTHTPGFATGIPGTDEATRLLERARLQQSADLREFAARVARLPLAADPGERYQYDGVQYEVLGRVIEVASGMPLERFVQQRILQPLHMADTGFSVPVAKRHRLVDITTIDADGRLVRAEVPGAESGAPLRPYTSLAGGLYSTAADYLRLCRMLLGGGTLDGVRLLSPRSVATMLTAQDAATQAPGRPASPAPADDGVALGGWVILHASPQGRPGSVGSYGWLGAASTYFMIDPRLQLVQILLLQHLPSDHGPGLPKLNHAFFARVYEALRR